MLVETESVAHVMTGDELAWQTHSCLLETRRQLVHLGCNIRLINKGSYPTSACARDQEQVTARSLEGWRMFRSPLPRLSQVNTGSHATAIISAGDVTYANFFFFVLSFFFFNPCASCIPLLVVPRPLSSTSPAVLLWLRTQEPGRLQTHDIMPLALSERAHFQTSR